MKECRFCQDEIPDGKEFKIVEPDGKTTSFCVTCAGDMIRYVESGQAESDNLQATEVIQPSQPYKSNLTIEIINQLSDSMRSAGNAFGFGKMPPKSWGTISNSSSTVEDEVPF